METSAAAETAATDQLTARGGHTRDCCWNRVVAVIENDEISGTVRSVLDIVDDASDLDCYCY